MTGRYCALPGRAAIEVRGRDAAAFLHGQLARALDVLVPGAAPLAAWLDSRGRVRALPRVVRLGEDRWLLSIERDVAEATASKLRMFVLRSAVTIAVGDYACGALVGTDDAGLLAVGLPAETPVDTAVTRGAAHAIRIGPVVWQLIGPAAALDDLGGALERGPASLAQRAEMALGIPAIGAAAADRYVAQMLNLDRLGAVTFDKGCYPGQEVVARVHNLGSVKRRARRYASSAAAPPAGAAVLTAAGEPVGEVVCAADAPVGSELLAVIDHAAADAELSVDGVPLRAEPLPFAVPSD
jgi:folate-binding protein YgfZ